MQLLSLLIDTGLHRRRIIVTVLLGYDHAWVHSFKITIVANIPCSLNYGACVPVYTIVVVVSSFPCRGESTNDMLMFGQHRSTLRRATNCGCTSATVVYIYCHYCTVYEHTCITLIYVKNRYNILLSSTVCFVGPVVFWNYFSMSSLNLH